MTTTELCGFMQNRETWSLDPGSELPIVPTEAMVRQAEVDASYLAVQAARADSIYQAKLQAEAAAARERAHRLRAAIAGPMPQQVGPVPVAIDAREALMERVE